MTSSKPKFHVSTWGCQMNVLDSQRMSGILEALGYESTEHLRDSDILLLNTCDVREKAESKLYSELGRLNEWKRERPGRLIGVTGCVAQRVGATLLERRPFVDFVIGTGSVERLPEAIETAREGRRAALLELSSDSPAYQFDTISRGPSSQALITVIEGCDQFCTFCVVPFTRGRERSRRAAEIEREAIGLAEKGWSEITLLGQTVNAYSCPETGLSLAGLLARLTRIEGIGRLRFLTSHPSFVTREFAEVLAREPRIARYFHLPAQSGSDRVLSRMKRRYTATRYREIVEEVRRIAADVAFSSDFIVGFPGETEEDFQATLRLIEEVRFSSLFGFLYSPRPGTASARWGSDSEVPKQVAKERLSRLLDLQRRIQKEQNRGLEGTVLPVLVEGEGRAGLWRGRSSCNRVVHFPRPPLARFLAGAFVDIRVEKGLENSLRGSVAASG
ncbi:MAG: tRNA (N6-isopentenyl adenosine(37)-C2)-methylthiotransferase MiaB [Thermoanaerobaculia bacterium]